MFLHGLFAFYGTSAKNPQCFTLRLKENTNMKTIPNSFACAVYAQTMRDNNESESMIDLAIYQANRGTHSDIIANASNNETFKQQFLTKCCEVAAKLDHIHKCIKWAYSERVPFRLDCVRYDFLRILNNNPKHGYETIPNDMVGFTQTLAMEFGIENANEIVARLMQLLKKETKQ